MVVLGLVLGWVHRVIGGDLDWSCRLNLMVDIMCPRVNILLRLGLELGLRLVLVLFILCLCQYITRIRKLLQNLTPRVWIIHIDIGIRRVCRNPIGDS